MRRPRRLSFLLALSPRLEDALKTLPTVDAGKISNILPIGNIFPISNICPIGNIFPIGNI
jgi:hypothetical protein